MPNDKMQRRAARGAGGSTDAAMRIAALNTRYPDLESVEESLRGTRAGAALTEMMDFVLELRDEMTSRVLSSAVGRNLDEARVEAMDFLTLKALADTTDSGEAGGSVGRRAARRYKARAAAESDCGCKGRRTARQATGESEDDDEPSYAGRPGGGARRELREETAPEAPAVFTHGSGGGVLARKSNRPDDGLR